jgi:predicted transposase YdaD
MLITDWNLDEAKEAWYEQGVEQGRKETLENFALNALAEGLSIESIQKITKLDIETIEQIKTTM